MRRWRVGSFFSAVNLSVCVFVCVCVCVCTLLMNGLFHYFSIYVDSILTVAETILMIMVNYVILYKGLNSCLL